MNTTDPREEMRAVLKAAGFKAAGRSKETEFYAKGDRDVSIHAASRSNVPNPLPAGWSALERVKGGFKVAEGTDAASLAAFVA